MYNSIVKNCYQTKRKKSYCFKKLSIIIILLLTIVLFIGIVTKGSKPINYIVFTVQEGDTLWSIVKSLELNNIDPRKMISEIKKNNNLDDVVLQPGQKIMIPEF